MGRVNVVAAGIPSRPRQATMWRMLLARYRFRSEPPGKVVICRSHGESKSQPSTRLNEAFYEPNDSGGCKGLDAIKKVRDEDPATFARIYAALLPKQLEIEDTSPEAALSDEQLERLEQHYKAILAGELSATGVNDKDQLAPGPQTVN